jgi:hypothetical protein
MLVGTPVEGCHCDSDFRRSNLPQKLATGKPHLSRAKQRLTVKISEHILCIRFLK